MDREFAGRLSARAVASGIPLYPVLTDALLAYFSVLSRWNAKMNLTSLEAPDAAIDRLLLEPVAAAAFLPAGPALMDLGSGGGSPAIPLALALNARHLVMVESRVRKAAFLREAVREVRLDATVEAARFEDDAVVARYKGAMDVVSMRAVRMDEASLRIALSFLKVSGVLALFVSSHALVEPPRAELVVTRHALLNAAELVLMKSTPR